MRIRDLLLTVAVSAVVAAGAAHFTKSDKTGTGARSNAWDRVQQSQTIRCGFATASGLHTVDPNTGLHTGMVYELMEEIGRRLNKKIVWAEEVSYSDIGAGFASGRYDMFCSSLWLASTRANASLLSDPFILSPVYAWVHPNDVAKAPDLTALNNSDLVLSIAEGDATEAMAKSRLPGIKTQSVPAMASVGQYIGQIVTRHAGVILTDPGLAKDFLKTNPNGIARVGDVPVVTFPVGFAFAAGDQDMKEMIDIAIRETVHDGTIDNLLIKYDRVGDILPVPKQY